MSAPGSRKMRRAWPPKAPTCSITCWCSGPRAGYDVELTRAVADSLTIPVIASGGVGTLDHLVAGIRDGHASAVLAASIFHFGEHTIAEAKAHMAAAGVAVRSVPQEPST